MIRAICIAAVTTALLALGLAIPVHADEVDPGKLMLVLDSSGSMKEKVGGTTKIAAAKDALGAVIDKLPAKQEVGLRVYGAKVFSAKDKGACTDSQRAVDLGTDNRAKLKGAVATYKPYGETPTGYALQQAGEDLGTDGQRTIVLVSDGESTCDPDPCMVAKALAKDGISLRIDVVGLDVSGKAREQLKCVAKSGKGTYYDANNAKSLIDTLTVTSTRASRPFDLTGQPVKGAADPADAPVLARGQYLDTFGTGDGLWYRVDRSAPNSTIHVGVTHRSADTGNFGDKAYVGVYAGTDENRCDYETSFARGNIAYTAASSWRPSTDECNTAKTLWVNVKQASTRRDFAGDPVEIVVYEEPPLANAAGTDLPPTTAKPTWTTLSPGAPKTGVVPGTSISNAPVIADGTYALDINPGETQVVAVPLDWGQNVQAQVDGTLTTQHHETHFEGPWVQVLGPIREAVDTDEYGVDSQPDDWTSRLSGLPDGISDYRTGSQSYTVGYRNRAESEAHLSGSSLAGLRYVQISYPAKSETPLAYTLTLKTNGKAGEGAPAYKKVAGLVAPEADSALVSGAGTGSDATKPAPATTRVDKKDHGGGLPVLPIGLGVIGVVLLGGAYVVLRNARMSA
jgi:Ca-activated chloride channel family protein